MCVVEYALLTANPTEQSAVKKLIGVGDYVPERYAGENRGAYTCEEDSILQLKVELLSIESSLGMPFDAFQVNGKNLIHVRCADIGSGGPGGSLVTTTQILAWAKKYKWPLKMIFCVGCCGCPEKCKVDRGYVILSKEIKDYNRGQMIQEAPNSQESQDMPTNVEFQPIHYQQNIDWFGILRDKKNTGEGDKAIPFKEALTTYSGDFVVKSSEKASEMAAGNNPKPVMVEMEGKGIAEALEVAKKLEILPETTDFIVVKGISDWCTPSDKKQSACCRFFTERPLNVSPEKRQHMATIQSATLVLRAIAQL